ncbi:MAG: hypothetical protein WC455_09995 [Dehalococcoidia bacterium]|jgi:hypothetical protein
MTPSEWLAVAIVAGMVGYVLGFLVALTIYHKRENRKTEGDYD